MILPAINLPRLEPRPSAAKVMEGTTLRPELS